MIIVIYVDDLLVIARLLTAVFNTVELINAAFPIRLLSELYYYLGMRIIRNRRQRQLMVTQDAYIDKIASKFKLVDLLPAIGALLGKSLALRLRTAPEGYQATSKLKTKYQTLVGSVLQLAYILRPDVCYKVGLLYRFLRNPTELHRDAVLYLLGYIVSTKTRGLLFQGGNSFTLTGYTDLLQADDADTRRSTSGMVFKLAGALVLFKSGRQTIVTLLSTEAEYVQLTLAAKEANYLAKLLEELQYSNVRLVTIYEDNQPAIDITNRSRTSSDSRTKHIDIRFRYIQQELSARNVVIEQTGTNDQAADRLTKALDKVKHIEFVRQLGLADCIAAVKAQKRALVLLDSDKRPIY